MRVLEILKKIDPNKIFESYQAIAKDSEALLTELLEQQTSTQILSDPSAYYLELVQALIAIDASRNLKNTNYQVYIQLGLLYFRNNRTSLMRKIFMETVFKYLQPRSDYLEGYNFFSEICTSIKTDVFVVEMAYALFFAYQLKNFEKVKDFLNHYFLRLDLNEYDYVKYYCMYFFYQGQYYLMVKDFERASLSFSTTLNLLSANPIVYNVFQIESIKRLSLLKYIVQDKFRELINKSIKEHEDILKTNQLDYYHALANFSEKNPTKVSAQAYERQASNSTNATKDFEFYLKKYMSKLKEDKLWGLAKIAALNDSFNKLKDLLNPYTRVYIKFVSENLGLNTNQIYNVINKMNIEKRCNIKIDEVTGILEIIDINPHKAFYQEKLIEYNRNIMQMNNEINWLTERKERIILSNVEKKL